LIDENSDLTKTATDGNPRGRVVFGSPGLGKEGRRISVRPEVPIVQLGVGTVGRVLMNKIVDWNRSGGARPRYSYAGLADSSGLIVREDGLSEEELEQIKELKEEGGKLSEVSFECVEEDLGPEQLFGSLEKGILVDVTDSADMEGTYSSAIDNGWSVVVANKVPLTTVDTEEFERFRQSGLLYETTVGAGLPVISTLDHLKRQGEDFEEIAAILSGSLSFILSRIEDGESLVGAVMEAKDEGYTEPDPSEDLLGNDVARKSVILGRSLGLDVSLESVRLNPLVPLETEESSAGGLEAQLEQASEGFADRVASSRERGNRLRYVARISRDEVTVGLEEVNADGPLGQGAKTANVILFRTNNYGDPPLVVQGPGAGPEVTAGGVLSDIKSSSANLI